MSETFNCPNCTASLEHDGGDHLTVQCPFCSTTVIVPEALRPKAYQKNFEPLLAHSTDLQHVIDLINKEQWEEAIYLFESSYGLDHDEAADGVKRLAAGMTMETSHIKIDLPKSARRGCGASCLVWLIIILAIGGALPYLIFTQGGEIPVSEVIDTLRDEEGNIDFERLPELLDKQAQLDLGTLIPDIDVNNLTGSDATLLIKTGSRGVNPGQFNDVRGFAVDGAGQIYAADRLNGRIQILDAQGEPISQWSIVDHNAVDALEIDQNGVLYAQQYSDIIRYEASSGEIIGELTYTEDTISVFSQMAINAAGEVYAINRPRQTIIHFGTDGQVLNTIEIEAIPNGIDASNLAVDGLGNLYVLGTARDLLGDRQDVVFKFTADGEYASQFGSSGNEPGTFRGIATAIAVDGTGHIYVADFQGVQVFDNNGRFLDLIPIQGAAFDLEFNPAGELVVITNQHILYIFDVSQIGQ